MDKYKLIVRFMEELALMGVPVIFKGAMTLSQYLTNNNINFIRMTSDVDINWLGDKYSMEQFRVLFQKAINRVDNKFMVEPYRKYDIDKCAGFKFIHPLGPQYSFSLDLCIGGNAEGCEYRTVINGVPFYGSTPTNMVSDKLTAISTRKVLRRMKDLLDLYQLSIFPGYSTLNILRITSGKMENFEVFLTQLEDIKHAYSKLVVPNKKPELKEVYQRVYKFAEPFIKGYAGSVDYTWNGNEWVQV